MALIRVFRHGRIPCLLAVLVGYGKTVRNAHLALAYLVFGCTEASNRQSDVAPESRSPPSDSTTEPAPSSPSSSDGDVDGPTAIPPAATAGPDPEPSAATPTVPVSTEGVEEGNDAGARGSPSSANGGSTGAGSGGREGEGGAPSVGSDAGAPDAGPRPTSGCASFQPASAIAELEAEELGQLSGLVASRRQPGIFYAHLDAGAPAELYVFDRSGAHLGKLVLNDLETRDWEDLTVTPPGEDGRSFVFVGDVGDNAARMGGTPRDDLSIVRFVEPDVPSGGDDVAVSDWERIPVAYPEESHDAETLMYDPIGRNLVVVTKDDSGASQVLTIPSDSPADEPVTLDLVAEVQVGAEGTRGAQASAGDISPTGDRILVRNYENALLWTRGPGQSLADALAAAPVVLETATEPQSEGISFAADGASWFSAGEQDPTLYEAVASCE